MYPSFLEFGRSRNRFLLLLGAVLLTGVPTHGRAQPQSVPVPGSSSPIALSRIAQPNTYFDQVGHKFAVLGVESGRVEAWAYPLKILRDFHFSFYVGDSKRPIRGRDVVHRITNAPASTTLRYVYQSFTVDATFVTPPERNGAILLLDVDSDTPITVECSFQPVLEPMWPGGIGGQYAFWDGDQSAYVLSEPTGENHGLVGSPVAEATSHTPAHSLSDTPNTFQIRVGDSLAGDPRPIPIAMAGGRGAQDSVRAVYEDLLDAPLQHLDRTREYYRDRRAESVQIETPDDSLDVAFEWAKVSYDNLVVEHPTLGRGLVAGLDPSGTGGRPGFGWFFGGDAYINSLSLNRMGFSETSRTALSFMRQFQRDDGKMAHEVSQAVGYVDWFDDYPYAYIHADTSPYYITAVHDYFRQTADTTFLESAWPTVTAAYDWSRSTDANGDGLMDNDEAGLGALEFGALTDIQTDVYLAAVWTRATEAMQQIASTLDYREEARQAQRDHRRAREAFSKFWNDETGQYAYAFNDDGQQVDETTPWSAVGSMWGYGTRERTEMSLRTLSSAELATDWGTRMMSVNSDRFEPLNYNYGAVWPFLTSWVATAQFANHRPYSGYPLLQATAKHTFRRALGHVSEVFSGSRHASPEASVPHQGFATAGTVFPLVRGLFGVRGNAPDHAVTFAPQLPPDWDHAQLARYELGDAQLSFDVRRTRGELVIELRKEGGRQYEASVEPAFGPGTDVRTVRVDGEPVDYEVSRVGQVVQPAVSVPLAERAVVTIEFESSVQLVPPTPRSTRGDPNDGLKIIDVRATDTGLRATVEGRGGQSYALDVVNGDLIGSVQGGTYRDGELRMAIPERSGPQFARHHLIIETR